MKEYIMVRMWLSMSITYYQQMQTIQGKHSLRNVPDLLHANCYSTHLRGLNAQHCMTNIFCIGSFASLPLIKPYYYIIVGVVLFKFHFQFIGQYSPFTSLPLVSCSLSLDHELERVTTFVIHCVLVCYSMPTCMLLDYICMW